MEFKWNKAKTSVGKVLARKRKREQSETNIKSHSFLKQIKLQESNEDPLNSDKKDPIQESSVYIKRKSKKDKLNLNNNKPESAKPVPYKNTNSTLFSCKNKDVHIVSLRGNSLVEEVFTNKTFSDLNIHKHIVSNLKKHSFTTLTNVQEKAIPVILDGKNAMIRSQTGSGKTLAFIVPIMNVLINLDLKLARNAGVQVLIIVPTRELALQTHEMFMKINWIIVGHLCGGENRKTEKDRLRKGVHILIATPGRLLDHILHTTALKIDKVRCLILDEADRLLDMGFKKDIIKIVEELDKAKQYSTYDPMAMLKERAIKPERKELENVKDDLALSKNMDNEKRQTILLSATLDKGIKDLISFTMKDYVLIDTLDLKENINSDYMIIPKSVRQEFVLTHAKHKLFTLCSILLGKTKNQCKVFVFMATSQMVDYYYELFCKLFKKMPINRGKTKIENVLLLEEDFENTQDDDEEEVLDTNFFKLHGSMDQNSRKVVFSDFKKAQKGVLLCTDVAGRGIDVPEADCIIQYTGPHTDEDYLHRVGRTGRVGKSGHSIIFLTYEEQDYVTKLQSRKLFLTKANTDDYLNHLCDLMEEPDREKAAMALQKRFEIGVANDKNLHKMACFAYSSWSRFYNTYPASMRSIFNFKNCNLGHYVTTFALQETPSSIAKIIQGKVSSVQSKKLNRKLAIYETNAEDDKKKMVKRKIKSICLTTSEYSSGLESGKRKKKTLISKRK